MSSACVPEILVKAPEHLILGFALDRSRPGRLVAVGGQRVDVALLSEDGGRTWQTLPSPGKGLRSAFLDGDELWVCGEYGFVARSRDGGATFSVVETGVSGCLFGVTRDVDGAYWIVGDAGIVLCSTDDGGTFKRVAGTKTSLSRVCRTDHGVLIPSDDPGDLYRATSTPKARLEKLAIGAGVDLMTATVTPTGTIVVVGNKGVCHRSTDGGATFQPVRTGTSQLLCGVCSTAAGRVVAVGAGGTVLTSDDDGASFETATAGLEKKTLWCCTAIGDDVIVGGDGGLIARLVPAERHAGPSSSTPRRDVVPGVLMDATLRAMVRPWRGCALGVVADAPPPLPSPSAAWATARALFWASDRLRASITGKPSTIWTMATEPVAASRRLSARLQEERRQPLTPDDGVALVRAAFDDGFQGLLGTALHNAVADLLVAELGIRAAVRCAMEGLEAELPYTDIGLFGRLRDRVVTASDADYAALLEEVPRILTHTLEGETDDGRVAHLRTVAAFLLPAGETEHPTERLLREQAARHIDKFGNLDIAHASLLASADTATLSTFLQKNKEPRHELFSGGARPYIATLLARGNGLLRERLADLRPRYDLNVEVWSALLARVDGPGVAAPTSSRPPLPGTDLMVRALGSPSAYVPPPSLAPADLVIPAALDLPPEIAFRDDEAAPEAGRAPYDGHWRWQPEGSADPEALLRQANGPDLDAWLALRERYQVPSPSAVYLVTPTRLHARLVALGAAKGEGRWNHWRGALLGSGDVVLPAVRAFAVGDGELDDRIATILPLGDVACVPAIVEAFVGKKHKALGRSWLLRHRRHGIAGALAIVAAGGHRGVTITDAARVLRFLDGIGEREQILRLARGVGGQLEAQVTTLLDEDPLTQKGAKPPALPAWLDVATLSVVDRAGAAVAPGAVRDLLVRLAASNADELHPALQAAKRQWSTTSLAAMARALFDTWLEKGADPKHGFCMLGLGVFGDDDAARHLATLARAWPGESAAARAQQALDVLVLHGSDAALFQLSVIAEKSKFAALKKGAGERIAAIAERRGLSEDELADRLVPTLGLEDDASTTLEFGARRFTVTFDEHLVPRVKDEGGTLLKDLPKPGKSDDAERAKAAKKQLAGLKKDVKAVADLLLRRLERAMIEGRAWSADAFRACFVQHPLSFHVARRLLWEARGADGRQLALFRLAEDRSFADVDDREWVLPPEALVRVAHPLTLGDEALTTWGERFADYELLQPFPQLGRPLHRVRDDERSATSLVRHRGRVAPAPKLVFGLEARGYRRFDVIDGGAFTSHVKELAGIRVLVSYEGAVGMGFIEASEPLTLDEVTFTATRPLQLAGRTLARGDALALGEVPVAVFSEAIADLDAVLS